MTFSRCIVADAIAVSLVAGTETGATRLQTAPGQSVDDGARGLTRTRAVAPFISAACRGQGIALGNPDPCCAVARDVRHLQARGFDPVALKAAFERAGKSPGLPDRAVSHLGKRGVQKGDVALVCAVGGREIAEMTPVGRLLKRG